MYHNTGLFSTFTLSSYDNVIQTTYQQCPRKHNTEFKFPKCSPVMTCVRGALLLEELMKTCSTALLILGSEKEMQSLPQEPWQNQLSFSMHRKSASHRESREWENLAVKFQYLITCFAKYPRRFKKNQPELLMWIT